VTAQQAAQLIAALHDLTEMGYAITLALVGLVLVTAFRE